MFAIADNFHSTFTITLGNANPGGIFQTGFTGLTASKPGYPGTRVYDYVRPAGGR